MSQIKTYSDGSECIAYNDAEYPVYAENERIDTYCGANFAYHWHDDIEFGLVTQGEIQYSINGEAVTVKAPCGIFINSRQMHGSRAFKGTTSEYRCVLIHPSVLQGKYSVIDAAVNSLKQNDLWVYQTLCPDVRWQKDVLRAANALYEAIRSSDVLHMLSVLARSLDIVALLAGNMPAKAELIPSIDKHIPSLRNMIGFIQTRYAEKISVKEICAAGNVGASTCYELFNGHFNMTPIGYLTRYRLNKAVELLKNRNLSITEVAYSTGFSGASYFCECFRRHFLMSPSQYRRQNKSVDQQP